MDRLLGSSLKYVVLPIINEWIEGGELAKLDSAITTKDGNCRQLFLTLIASNVIKSRFMDMPGFGCVRFGAWMLLRGICPTNLTIGEAEMKGWRGISEVLLKSDRLNRLKKLHLNFNRQARRVKFWIEFLSQLSCLKELEISNLDFEAPEKSVDNNLTESSSKKRQTSSSKHDFIQLQPLEVASFMGCDIVHRGTLDPLIVCAKRLRIDGACRILLSIVSTCSTDLIELTIMGSAIEISSYGIIKLSKKCRQLQILNLPMKYVINDNALLCIANNCHDIQCINFTYSRDITTECVEKALPLMKNLTHLSVYCETNDVIQDMLITRPDLTLYAAGDIRRIRLLELESEKAAREAYIAMRSQQTFTKFEQKQAKKSGKAKKKAELALAAAEANKDADNNNSDNESSDIDEMEMAKRFGRYCK